MTAILTEVQVNCSSMAVGFYHSVPGSAPPCKRLNVREWDGMAVHEKAALWVMGASHSEGNQGTSYHPDLRGHINTS